MVVVRRGALVRWDGGRAADGPGQRGHWRSDPGRAEVGTGDGVAGEELSMEPQNAGAAAAARAEAAGRRTKEIAERLARLAGGHPSDPADLRAARQRAEEAQERAQQSLDRAVAGHERAARSHDHTAEVHDEARRRGLGDAAEHGRRADQHRRDAEADRQEAVLDRARRAPALAPAQDEPGQA
jgi:hypothetical protein